MYWATPAGIDVVVVDVLVVVGATVVVVVAATGLGELGFLPLQAAIGNTAATMAIRIRLRMAGSIL